MNLMDFLRAIVYLLVFSAMVTSSVLIALDLFKVYSISALWRYSPLWIGGAGIVCILAFVGLVVMFRRQ